eukprot:XP_013996679.1 PREDICTED: YEATS domain-containing protein 2-like [Salmo salar]
MQIETIPLYLTVSQVYPPDKREKNDQSTHKWMVYVRGSRREPSNDHFVNNPSYKPNDPMEVRSAHQSGEVRGVQRASFSLGTHPIPA